MPVDAWSCERTSGYPSPRLFCLEYVQLKGVVETDEVRMPDDLFAAARLALLHALVVVYNFALYLVLYLM